jgi:hypothetical protein
MIKPFLVLVFLLIVMVSSMSLHYLNFPINKTIEPMLHLTQLTNHSKLSLSTAYSEQCFNPIYPEMTSLKRMDFIYE